MSAQAVAAGGSLSLIIRAGGNNTIDIKALQRRGSRHQLPEKHLRRGRRLAIGLLIAADRRIADALIDLRAGEWLEYGKAHGLKDRTLGIIGLGNIRHRRRQARSGDGNER